MYLATLSSFKDGWAEVVWEELFLELSYKDIHDFECPIKIFKVVVYIGAHYASFEFTRTKSILLTDKSTIISTMFLNQNKNDLT